MTPTTSGGRHATPEQSLAPQGVWAEFKDAVALRTVGLILGVLLLQLAFVLSYVGAFHAPTPHRIPVGVVAASASSAGQSAATQTAAGLNALPAYPIDARVVADEGSARSLIERGDLSAALVINGTSTQDTLLVASGGGASVVSAVTEVFTEVASGQGRTLVAQDIVPLQSGDGRGLTGFYLVIGWIVGGYLVAALLGVAAGSRPANPRRAYFRLAAIVPYSILSGLGGALIVDQVLGALTGHFMALWWIGALLVAAAATVTMAFQVLFGVIGIGLTVLVFVILGNPSAGGAYQAPLLPAFWRSLSSALPNGAGTDAVRRIVYLGSNGISSHLLVIAAYVVIGAVVAAGASHLHHRRGAAPASPLQAP
ncbi:DUF3533 domain-containing protein [Nakamurella antarctica]|uniref:DUF3533 domain-containing protein n=1 Tax=Nakamurella antarctica TaxID=1902245 RepID=A0A3G8ZIL6_9ACTN|nr:DUF3533 domain-containing protein [Nakamurella antarctica]AZI57173.1 DUF3533 domain-containing protein [Nakamurella antarctica]